MTWRQQESVLPDFVNIAQEIWQIVQNDDQLEAFDVIPQEEKPEENQSPLKYENHNIGLEHWYVKHLFVSIYRTLRQETIGAENQKAFLTIALLLNCNVKTFWNMRRELVKQNQLDELVELRFINLILSFWRKCPDAIYYRKWLLRDTLQEKPLEFLISELDRIHDVADRHNNNHVIWDYCVWLHGQCRSHSEFATFTHTAWHLSGQYVSTHPSDASHMHYRQQIIKNVIHNRQGLRNLFLSLATTCAVKEGFTDLDDDDFYLIGIILYEFDLNTSLINFWSNHEGIWSYRKFLTWCWFKELPDLVSQRGRIKAQELLFGSKSECPFRMYFFSSIQQKFLKTVRNDSSYVLSYKNWIDSFI